MIISRTHTYAVIDKNKTYSCVYDMTKKSVQLDAIAHHFHLPPHQSSKKTINELAYDVVINAPRPIHNILDPTIESYTTIQITNVVRRMKHAVNIIEMIMLNPHTRLGKKRLMREFELIINDEDFA